MDISRIFKQLYRPVFVWIRIWAFLFVKFVAFEFSDLAFIDFKAYSLFDLRSALTLFAFRLQPLLCFDLY